MKRLARHADGSPPPQLLIEPVICSKIIDYRTDVLGGKIKGDPAIDAALREYADRGKPLRTVPKTKRHQSL